MSAQTQVKVKDLGLNRAGYSISKLAEVASTEATWTPLFDASVILTSAPNR